MMKKTLIASALIGLFATTTAIANEETDQLRKVITLYAIGQFLHLQ